MIEQASLIIGEGNWAVKSDNLLGYKLLNGGYYPREIGVTRATTGTRVNADGLVEVVPYNLVQYSEQFDNVYWNKNNINIVANSLVAPNGTTTADTMTSSGTTSFTYIATSSLVGTYTLSFYAKKGTSDYCWVYLNGYNAIFNLNTGAYVTSISNAPQSYNIENVGNGWYRVSITQANPALDGVSGIGVATASSFNGVVGSNIYIWGAQLVEGSVAKDYLPTTDRLDVARIDYSSGSGALLVEPQRTNLALYSSSFDNSAWTNGNSSITSNAIISPSGIQDADKLVENTSNGNHNIYQPITIGNIPMTFSVYLKKAERSYCNINMSDLSTGDASIRVNLNDGTLSSTGIAVGSWTNISSTIINVGNGWYRVTLSATKNAGASSQPVVTILNDSQVTPYTGNGTSGVYIWGAQLELGSYATSYIPTQAASVTRNADVISKTGISGLIGQTEGTIFLDIYRNNQSESFGLMLANALGTNSYMNSIYIFQLPNNLLTCDCFVSNTQQFSLSLAGGLSNGRHKIALAYKQNDAVLYVDGNLIASDASCNIPSMTSIDIAQEFTASSYKNNATAIFKTRLTNTQLAQLTTL